MDETKFFGPPTRFIEDDEKYGRITAEKFSWPERPNLAKLCSPLHADVFHAIREWRAARKAGAAADSLTGLFRTFPGGPCILESCFDECATVGEKTSWPEKCLVRCRVCGKWSHGSMVVAHYLEGLCVPCERWATNVLESAPPEQRNKLSPVFVSRPRRPKFFVTERAIPPSRVDTNIPW